MGFRLVTSEISYALPQINEVKMGLCQIFLHHTSASLILNENGDPRVREDFETWFDGALPENESYNHNEERIGRYVLSLESYVIE